MVNRYEKFGKAYFYDVSVSNLAQEEEEEIQDTAEDWQDPEAVDTEEIWAGIEFHEEELVEY